MQQTRDMNSGLADFIERHSEAIVEQAIAFARTVEVGTPLDQVTLRDHLPEIIAAIVADLRTHGIQPLPGSHGGAPVKRTLGRTASQVVQERVVLEAKRWLSNTETGIAEIAFRLNIEDPAYFTRFFKKQTGLTPGDFRRQHCRPLD